MGFWEKTKESVYSPSFYREVVRQPLSSAFKYYFAVVAVLSLFIAGAFAFEFIPTIKEFFDSGLREVVSAIPEELVVHIKDNKVETNASSSEPIIIGREAREPQEPAYFVIDTVNPFSLELYEKYNSYVWVSRDSLILEDRDGIRVWPIQNVSDLTLTRGFVAEKIDEARGYLVWLYVLIIPGVFVLSMLFHATTLFYLLLGALVVWAIAKGRGIALTFGESYRISLYAVTASLVFRVFSAFVLPFSVPFGFSLIFIFVVLFNLDPKFFTESVVIPEEGNGPRP